MAVRPLNDRVLVKRLESEEKTKGGIIIPDAAKEKPLEGKVIPLVVKKGDRVLFGKYSGTEIKIDGEEVVIVREDDILAVIE